MTYENIRKIAIGHGDDYTISCLIDYAYFKKDYKMIVIAFQQINFTENLDRDGNTRFYYILAEVKETVFEFSQGTVKVL